MKATGDKPLFLVVVLLQYYNIKIEKRCLSPQATLGVS